jgi:hypothetical protein
VRRDFEYARLAGMPLIVAAPSTDSLDVVEHVAKEFKIRVDANDPLPGMQQSLAYMRGVLAGLTYSNG